MLVHREYREPSISEVQDAHWAYLIEQAGEEYPELTKQQIVDKLLEDA